jgi:tetratricopeptide (TPR) repeat protein
MAAQGAAVAGGGVVRQFPRIARVVAGALLLVILASVGFAQKSAGRETPTKEPTGIAGAEKAMDQQKWAEAEALLRKLVAADSKDARAWFDLGYVMHAQENYREAIAAYRGAVNADPQSFECNLNLGMMLAHESSPEASKYLETATRLKPTNSHPQESLSRAWTALAETQARSAPNAALDSWSHAVTLAPGEARYRLAYGEALENSGDTAGAEREFRKARELQPNSTDALAALSNLFMRSKRLDEAETSLRGLVALAPQDESAHLQLGSVLSVEKKDAEAAAELNKALALRADDWEALRELAFVQERDKEYPAAEKNYRALLQKFPNDAELHNGLGAVLLPQLKYAEAQAQFIACIRLKPDWGETYGQLALAASGNKEYGLAIKALDTRKKLLPELASTYFLRATCYDHLRQFAEAVENYKAFLASSQGQFPDEEWKARHRLIAIEPEAKRKK